MGCIKRLTKMWKKLMGSRKREDLRSGIAVFDKGLLAKTWKSEKSMHFAWEGYQTLNENVKKLMGFLTSKNLNV